MIFNRFNFFALQRHHFLSVLTHPHTKDDCDRLRPRAVELSTTDACVSPDKHLSTGVDWLNSYCATFSLAIVWSTGRETHKSLPSLSRRKSDQATPLQTFQQHPPHHQRMLKPRLHDTIKWCPVWESRVKSLTTAVSVFPTKFTLCLLALIFKPEAIINRTVSNHRAITGDIEPHQSKQKLMTVPEIGG